MAMHVYYGEDYRDSNIIATCIATCMATARLVVWHPSQKSGSGKSQYKNIKIYLLQEC